MTYTNLNRRRFLQRSLATGAGLGVFGGTGMLSIGAARTRSRQRHSLCFCVFLGRLGYSFGLRPKGPRTIQLR